MKKNRLLSFIICTLFISVCFGQKNQRKTDSISSLLKQAASDSLMVRHHLELGILKDTSIPKEAEGHFLKALKLLGTNYTYDDKLEKMALAHDCLGIIERRKNNYDLAYTHYLKALKIKEKEKDTFMIGRSYHNIAMLFSAQHNYDKAITYIKKALPIRKLSDSLSYAISLNNYGYFLYRKKQYNEALILLDSAKIYFGSHMKLADANNYISLIYIKQKHYEKALATQKQVLAIYKTNEKLERVANTLKNLAVTSRKLKRYNDAIKYLDSSQKIAQRYGNKKLIAVLYKERYRIAKSQRKYELALKHYRTFKKYEDSVFKTNKFETIKLLELKYNNEKKAITDSLSYEANKAQLVSQNATQRAQKRWYAILFFVSVLCLIAFIFAYHYQRRTNIQNTQKQELEANLLNEQIHFLRYKIEHLLTDNKMRTNFNEELAQRIRTLHKSENSMLLVDEYKSILMQLKNQVQAEKRLDNITDNLHKMENSIELKLKTDFPLLTKSEREICHLIYLNLSTKEIMNARNMTLPSIKSIRYRIRKKLVVPKGDELEFFIKQLFNEKAN